MQSWFGLQLQCTFQCFKNTHFNHMNVFHVENMNAFTKMLIELLLLDDYT